MGPEVTGLGVRSNHSEEGRNDHLTCGFEFGIAERGHEGVDDHGVHGLPATTLGAGDCMGALLIEKKIAFGAHSGGVEAVGRVQRVCL